MLTWIVNNSECKLRMKYSIAECYPIIQVKKPVEGKENKLHARGATPNRRSTKRFRSPGLDDASSGEYSYKDFPHFQGTQDMSIVSDDGLLSFC